MTILLHTHLITVTRVEDATDTDPYDPASDHPAPTTIATGVRAVVSPPSGLARLDGGDRVVYDAQLRCDYTALEPDDVVNDGTNSWTVLTVTQINALGLKFTQANLRLVQGAA